MYKDKVKDMIGQMLDPRTDLRNRLFQLLSTIGLCEFILVTAYTIVIGGDLQHIILMIAGTAAFALCVSFTFKTEMTRAGAALSGIIYYLMYMTTFNASGGMYGGAPVTFVFSLVFVFLVTQKTERVVLMICCIAATAFCYVGSYLHPEILSRHTVAAEHVESFFSILLVVLLLCMLFAFVTEVYKAENRIVNEQKAEIERLHQAQKNFFSSMSHEIRTPVNAIVGLNEMILREDISDEVREDAENIEAASKMLLHTINEILDMSRLEAGTIELRKGIYSTKDLVAETDSIIRMSAGKKGLEFVTETDPDIPEALEGDEIRIRQILLNLTANAIKYTKSGRVSLKAGGRTGEDGSYTAVYEVADTGIGIREEDIPYLFTAYRRIDEDENSHIEGTGLGLMIVSQLLDMMGGSISVSSEYGKGSTFRVEIPQRIADKRLLTEYDVGEKTTPDESNDISQLRILAVDDTRMNLMVIEKLLRGKNAPDTAESGEEALQMTMKAHYDVILMDHQMPGMDGIECLHRIRTQEGGLCRESKVICLTANAGREMEQLYISEGFDGYLSKPVKGADLEKAIAGTAGQ